jgi:hypothetical protein
MNQVRRVFVRITILILSLHSVCASEQQGEGKGLLVCGFSEVFLMNPVDSHDKGVVKKLWSWRAKDRPELPEAMRGSFGTTDECKPLADGKRILISSSSGGCALVAIHLEMCFGMLVWLMHIR